jgi:hypothetical protein
LDTSLKLLPLNEEESRKVGVLTPQKYRRHVTDPRNFNTYPFLILFENFHFGNALSKVLLHRNDIMRKSKFKLGWRRRHITILRKSKRYRGAARTGWHKLYYRGFDWGPLRILFERYEGFEAHYSQMRGRRMATREMPRA